MVNVKPGVEAATAATWERNCQRWSTTDEGSNPLPDACCIRARLMRIMAPIVRVVELKKRADRVTLRWKLAPARTVGLGERRGGTRRA